MEVREMAQQNKRVKALVGILMGVSMIWVSGCDFLDGFFHRKAEIDAVVRQPPQPEVIPQAPAAPEPPPTKGECATLRHYIMTRLKLLKGRQSETDKELTGLKLDRQKFSERVRELSEVNLADTKGTHASGLVLLLNDGVLNELAYKYLGTDFAVIRHEFSEKVRNAIALEQKNRKELELKRSKIEESVAEARVQAEHARKENAANIARLRKEIEAKEKRLRSLQKDMRQYRETTKEESAYLQGEISRLKSELQQEMQSSRVRDAKRDLEWADRKASSDNKYLEEMSARKGNNDVSIEQLTDRYGKMTVQRLESALHEAHLKAQKSQKLLSEQALFLESITTGLETLDTAGLKRVRAEVENELARTVETAGK